MLAGTSCALVPPLGARLVRELKIKNSYENYLADILGVGSGDENEGSRFSPKKTF